MNVNCSRGNYFVQSRTTLYVGVILKAALYEMFIFGWANNSIPTINDNKREYFSKIDKYFRLYLILDFWNIPKIIRVTVLPKKLPFFDQFVLCKYAIIGPRKNLKRTIAEAENVKARNCGKNWRAAENFIF